MSNEPNETQYMVRPPGGGEYGPASIAMIVVWAREGRVARDAMIVGNDGGPPVMAASHPMLGSIVNAPPTVGGVVAMHPMQDDGGVSVIIPYKNGAALAGYYTSVASLIPFLGLVLGPVAVVLGVMGLRAVKRNPAAHGTAHAWVAIVLGGLVTLAHVGGIVAIAVAAMR